CQLYKAVRINRFEKKAGRKMKFNNRDAARFDKKKVKCYKCSELGHFARECTGKQLDSKARCIIHEGGLALFQCYSWTVWPSFDDKEFLLVG
ncbi:ribonuclease H-like domain-containing protein, partial [Tanacetum coccineum]